MTANYFSSLAFLLAAYGAAIAQPPAQTPPPPAVAAPRGISLSEAARIPPYAPRNVIIDVIKGETTITWDRSRLPSVLRYRVYRKSGDEKFVKIAETGDTQFVDKAARKGVSYSVTAVNAYGAESSFAAAVAPKKP
jgi:hypothetical protein